MSLRAQREALAAQLSEATEMTFHSHVPDQIEPPCGVIAPADGYLGQGQTFGEFNQQLDVWVLVPAGGDNEQIADELDAALELVVTALGDWFPTACGQPGPVESADWDAHGVNLTVVNQTTIN